MKQGKVITLDDLRESKMLTAWQICKIIHLKSIDRIIETDTEVQVYHNEWKVNRYTRRDK